MANVVLVTVPGIMGNMPLATAQALGYKNYTIVSQPTPTPSVGGSMAVGAQASATPLASSTPTTQGFYTLPGFPIPIPYTNPINVPPGASIIIPLMPAPAPITTPVYPSDFIGPLPPTPTPTYPPYTPTTPTPQPAPTPTPAGSLGQPSPQGIALVNVPGLPSPIPMPLSQAKASGLSYQVLTPTPQQLATGVPLGVTTEGGMIKTPSGVLIPQFATPTAILNIYNDATTKNQASFNLKWSQYLQGNTYIVPSDQLSAIQNDMASLQLLNQQVNTLVNQSFVKIGNNLPDKQLLTKNDFNSLTPIMQGLVLANGLEAISVKGLTPQQTLDKYKEWGVVTDKNAKLLLDAKGNPQLDAQGNILIRQPTALGTSFVAPQPKIPGDKMVYAGKDDKGNALYYELTPAQQNALNATQSEMTNPAMPYTDIIRAIALSGIKPEIAPVYDAQGRPSPLTALAQNWDYYQKNTPSLMTVGGEHAFQGKAGAAQLQEWLNSLPEYQRMQILQSYVPQDQVLGATVQSIQEATLKYTSTLPKDQALVLTAGVSALTAIVAGIASTPQMVAQIVSKPTGILDVGSGMISFAGQAVKGTFQGDPWAMGELATVALMAKGGVDFARLTVNVASSPKITVALASLGTRIAETPVGKVAISVGKITALELKALKAQIGIDLVKEFADIKASEFGQGIKQVIDAYTETKTRAIDLAKREFAPEIQAAQTTYAELRSIAADAIKTYDALRAQASEGIKIATSELANLKAMANEAISNATKAYVDLKVNTLAGIKQLQATAVDTLKEIYGESGLKVIRDAFDQLQDAYASGKLQAVTEAGMRFQQIGQDLKGLGVQAVQPLIDFGKYIKDSASDLLNKPIGDTGSVVAKLDSISKEVNTKVSETIAKIKEAQAKVGKEVIEKPRQAITQLTSEIVAKINTPFKALQDVLQTRIDVLEQTIKALEVERQEIARMSQTKLNQEYQARVGETLKGEVSRQALLTAIRERMAELSKQGNELQQELKARQATEMARLQELLAQTEASPYPVPIEEVIRSGLNRTELQAILDKVGSDVEAFRTEMYKAMMKGDPTWRAIQLSKAKIYGEEPPTITEAQSLSLAKAELFHNLVNRTFNIADANTIKLLREFTFKELADITDYQTAIDKLSTFVQELKQSALEQASKGNLPQDTIKTLLDTIDSRGNIVKEYLFRKFFGESLPEGAIPQVGAEGFLDWSPKELQQFQKYLDEWIKDKDNTQTQLDKLETPKPEVKGGGGTKIATELKTATETKLDQIMKLTEEQKAARTQEIEELKAQIEVERKAAEKKAQIEAEYLKSQKEIADALSGQYKDETPWWALGKPPWYLKGQPYPLIPIPPPWGGETGLAAAPVKEPETIPRTEPFDPFNPETWPAPEPVKEPEIEPERGPIIVPVPTPSPIIQPEPVPDIWPSPEPAPTPKPSPEPGIAPITIPKPSPITEPEKETQPSPAIFPQPQPEPSSYPQPKPTPKPQPQSTPFTQLQPQPYPYLTPAFATEIQTKQAIETELGLGVLPETATKKGTKKPIIILPIPPEDKGKEISQQKWYKKDGLVAWQQGSIRQGKNLEIVWHLYWFPYEEENQDTWVDNTPPE